MSVRPPESTLVRSAFEAERCRCIAADPTRHNLYLRFGTGGIRWKHEYVKEH